MLVCEAFIKPLPLPHAYLVVMATYFTAQSPSPCLPSRVGAQDRLTGNKASTCLPP